jgi:hypothetical protein
VRESNVGAMCEFCKAKASTARRDCEKFPSGNLLVVDSFRRESNVGPREIELASSLSHGGGGVAEIL